MAKRGPHGSSGRITGYNRGSSFELALLHFAQLLLGLTPCAQLGRGPASGVGDQPQKHKRAGRDEDETDDRGRFVHFLYPQRRYRGPLTSPGSYLLKSASCVGASRITL